MSKQAATFGQATDIWKSLAKGNYTVDAETKAKARRISQMMVTGVLSKPQTVSFPLLQHWQVTTARSLEKMRDAFVKGYKQAEKQWGGKLP